MTGGIKVYPESLTSTSFLIVVCSIVFLAIAMWLILRSGHNYTVHDTESHAVDYGNVIKEGHGGITIFLGLSFTLLFVWAIFYLVTHWSEFTRLFSLWRIG